MIPKDRALKTIIIISIVITILLPVINIYYVYPLFSKLLIEYTEEEATRTANHLESMLLSNVSDISKDNLPANFDVMVEKTRMHFDYIKLKVFSESGEIIYSTDPADIGKLNNKSYFHEIVAKGGNYSKVVQKDTKSLEGQVVQSDVVEIYVPIMRNDRFSGAFEVYYDITSMNSKLDHAMILSSAIPLIATFGFLVMIIVVSFKLDKKILEIIQHRRTEEELIRLSTKLQQSNRELQDFIQIASHDLQEPLRKVMSFGDWIKIKHSETLDSQGRDYVDRMHNSAKRMQELINSLGMFSRLTTKAEPFEQVDLGAVAQKVMLELKDEINEKNAQVKIGWLPTTEADKAQIYTLFYNLISNSLKFSKKDTPPKIRIDSSILYGKANSADNQSEEKTFYQIAFNDNGTGFEEKYTDRIFNMFQRLHMEKEHKGTGVGLSFCRKIVERHGGTITATSVPGEGSTFKVTLPASHDGSSGEGQDVLHAKGAEVIKVNGGVPV